MKRHILEIAAGLLLIVVGLVLLHFRLGNERVYSAPPNIVIQASTTPSAPGIVSGVPVKLQLPSLNKTLTVINGYYYPQTRQWTLTLDKAQYAVISAKPNNQSGDTFIYGHYRSEVFATLHLIKIGAQAIITTDNNHVFTYQLVSIKTIDPTDVSIFAYQGPPILTLQTCTGTFFQNRQFFTFKLVGYQ